MSDYRILKIVNEHTLLIESPDGRTHQININDAKPVSSADATDNALHEFKQSALRKEHTHPYKLQSLFTYIYEAAQQLSNWKTKTQKQTQEKVCTFSVNFPSPITDKVPSLLHPALTSKSMKH